MSKAIVVINGHPDQNGDSYVWALADSYERGAKASGHEVARVDVGRLDFETLREADAFNNAPTSPDILQAQKAIAAADHLVILYPLWLGTMPALFKAFLEQICCGGFAIAPKESGMRWEQKLKGKSARIIITMGMPAFAYRWIFRAHSLKSLERNILRFAGIKPIRETLIGLVEKSASKREVWLKKVEKLGKDGA